MFTIWPSIEKVGQRSWGPLALQRYQNQSQLYAALQASDPTLFSEDEG